MTDLKHRILPTVQKPARYTGGEFGEVQKNPADGECALDVLMIAKYYERIGDHATNVAEWVEFSLTGVHKGA